MREGAQAVDTHTHTRYATHLVPAQNLLARDAQHAGKLVRGEVREHHLGDVRTARVLVAAREVRVGEAEPPPPRAVKVEAAPAALVKVHLVHVRRVLLQRRHAGGEVWSVRERKGWGGGGRRGGKQAWCEQRDG